MPNLLRRLAPLTTVGLKTQDLLGSRHFQGPGSEVVAAPATIKQGMPENVEQMGAILQLSRLTT